MQTPFARVSYFPIHEMNRYICVHGHFYQPPRENPWLETVEHQESAHPWHDWNERITEECYARNAAARVLDDEKRIVQIVNLYSRISFNFGPTLLSWLEEKAPDVHQAVVDADRDSVATFSGHGSALAQAYNHTILPLSNRRDRVTQVVWGIRDFKHRFGRDPEGMWLPECAVDVETLDILAAHGIQFTILSPLQAARVRVKGGEWEDVTGGRVDPRVPYEAVLPSGRKIGLFFYDGPVSQGIAFEKLLSRGESFANRLAGCFSDTESPQLVHVATDGETYGHHHRVGEMGLAYALHHIEEEGLAKITNYGEYLEKFPPEHEVEIVENSSWSCSHGIERWRSSCGCNSGGPASGSQEWRGPLREALDWLRDRVNPWFEERAKALFKDPWEARDNYVSVILDRSSENVDRFLEKNASPGLSPEDRITVLTLMELQRNAMLTYTSCGWFFDDISGIETIQVMRYAARVIQLANRVFNESLEAEFLARLERAPSNLSEYGNGRGVYEKRVSAGVVDLARVAAHYGVSSLFESYGESAQVYCYEVTREEHKLLSAGNARMVIGRARITSRITERTGVFSFGVIHMGDHNINGGVRVYQDTEAYAKLVDDLTAAFGKGNLAESMRLLDQHFASGSWSLSFLFEEEQRRILAQILESTLQDTEGVYRQVFDRNAPLMRFLRQAGAPLPAGLELAAQFVLNSNLQRELDADEYRPDLVRALMEEASALGVELDVDDLSHALQGGVDRAADVFLEQPGDAPRMKRLTAAVDLAEDLPFQIDLARAQDAYYRTLRTVYPGIRSQGETEGNGAAGWIKDFRALGEKLLVKWQE